jgi:hypothetical protein
MWECTVAREDLMDRQLVAHQIEVVLVEKNLSRRKDNPLLLLS